MEEFTGSEGFGGAQNVEWEVSLEELCVQKGSIPEQRGVLVGNTPRGAVCSRKFSLVGQRVQQDVFWVWRCVACGEQDVHSVGQCLG